MDAAREPKISIIVPVYNAEAYLRKCLDSIAAQTHKNLEVILVDDGSPDNCPAICDEYAANDPRFKTIHKENGGSASGYNAGLDAATGEWIGFVDNDDWVEPDMFEYLLAGAQRHGVKMAACGFCSTDGQREISCTKYAESVTSGRQAVEMLLDRTMPLCFAPWQKLYARKLWDNVRFWQAPGGGPPDILSAFAVLMQTDAVVWLPEVKYHYRERKNSYSASISLRYMMGNYQVREELHNGIFAQEPGLRAKATKGLLLTAWGIWGFYYTAARAERREVLPRLREISAFCRPYIGQAVQDPNFHHYCGRAGRIGCRLVAWPTWWSFALSQVLWKLYEWKHAVMRRDPRS